MKVLPFLTKLAVTEFALYEDEVELCCETIEHSPAELNSLLTPLEQGVFRYNAMMSLITEKKIVIDDVDIVITQGGVETLAGGIYLVDRRLSALMEESRIDENVRRSAVFLAANLANHINGKSDHECLPLLIEPAMDNEIMPEAALSGVKDITRAPVYHAFSHRAAASLFLDDMYKGSYDGRMIIAHLGIEISVGAFDMGRIIDSNSPLDGEGPFSSTTSGALPTGGLLELCYSGRYDMDEILRLVTESGGLAAHLGDGSLSSVEGACLAGDETTIFLVRAMAYRVAKEIGARAVALRGDVEGIVFTGPWALFKFFVDEITARVKWIAPVRTYVWQSELYLLMISAARTFEGNVRIDLYGQSKI